MHNNINAQLEIKMSKDKNPSVNEVIKKQPNNYLSITELIAKGQTATINQDWVSMQEAAKAGDVKKVDNLLFSPNTNDTAKRWALDEIFSFPSQPSGSSYKASPNSILSLLSATGYTKNVCSIIDSQIKQITDLQEKLDIVPNLDMLLQLRDWQDRLNTNISNILTIGVKRGNSKLIGHIFHKFQGKLDLDDFNSGCPRKNTLLATAAKSNHFSVVKELLQYKADPNAGNGQTEMPLIHAIYNGNVKMAELLIKKGARLDNIAIHRGSIIDQNDQCKFFADQISVKDAIATTKNSQEKMIYLAWKKGDKDIFQHVIGGKISIIEHLLIQKEKASDSPNITQHSKVITLLTDNIRNKIVILQNNIDKLLTIATKDGNEGAIDLICGTTKSNSKILELNLDKLHSQCRIENTLLATAAKLNHFPVVRKLLTHKADPNAGNEQTEMPLINAIANGNIAMAELLIKKGARLDNIAIHRGSIVDENGQYQFFENPINVEDAIKLAPNSKEMEHFINEIKAKEEFLAKEMLKNGANSLIFSRLNDDEIIEVNLPGQNHEIIEEQ